MPINQKTLNYIISKIEGLPTLPTVLTKVLDLVQSPNSSAKQITEVISKDQSLSSKVLKLANSSYYGFAHDIGNMNHAVVILGMDTVKALCLATSVFDMFPTKDDTIQIFSHEKFWQHSLGVAVSAKVIAAHIGFQDQEEIFLAGLLHDIGKIILEQYFHDEFVQISKLVTSQDILLVKAEEMVLGINHAILGKVLAKRWNLPATLVDTISAHHALNWAQGSEAYLQVCIIHLADILARAKLLGNGGDNKIPLLNREAWKRLGLPVNKLEPLMLEIGTEYIAANRAFFGERA